jgi:hypothetical protein
LDFVPKGELINILLCHWLIQAVRTSRPTVPGSDYVCLDINKLMYDLEHDDETVVIPRTIREWNLLPASVTDADKLEEFRGRIQNLPEPLYAY